MNIEQAPRMVSHHFGLFHANGGSDDDCFLCGEDYFEFAKEELYRLGLTDGMVPEANPGNAVLSR